MDDLAGRVAARERLLDLASGPGRVALALAPRFARVLAIDLEPEMIEVGRAEAERRGIGNVEWRVGRAEEQQLEADAFDLVTIGDAFHRLDQRRVAALALEALKRGGAVAVLGSHNNVMEGDDGWQTRVAAVSRAWAERAAGSAPAAGLAGAELAPTGFARVLRQAGFTDVEGRTFTEPRSWSCEEILGFLRSTSTCSTRALGDHMQPFADELRAALGSDGPFQESFEAGYTIGWKTSASLRQA